MKAFIYSAMTFVVGFCATSAALHVWIYGTIRWPITYLAAAIFALTIKTFLFHDILRNATIEAEGYAKAATLTHGNRE